MCPTFDGAAGELGGAGYLTLTCTEPARAAALPTTGFTKSLHSRRSQTIRTDGKCSQICPGHTAMRPRPPTKVVKQVNTHDVLSLAPSEVMMDNRS